MRAGLRIQIVLIVLLVGAIAAMTAAAQPAPPPQPAPEPAPGPPYSPGPTYSSDEVVDAGHRFFGTVRRSLAQIVEKAGSQFGLPNGYILGQEGGGAFIGGLRFGEAALYTKNAGDLRVFWQGPTVGWDF